MTCPRSMRVTRSRSARCRWTCSRRWCRLRSSTSPDTGTFRLLNIDAYYYAGRYKYRVVQLNFTQEIKVFCMLFNRALSIFYDMHPVAEINSEGQACSTLRHSPAMSESAAGLTLRLDLCPEVDTARPMQWRGRRWINLSHTYIGQLGVSSVKKCIAYFNFR